jgi:hypothetical protein
VTDREVLEGIADAIVTGRPFDWDVTATMSSPGLRELLGELRVIAGIAELHRSVARRSANFVTTDDGSGHDPSDGTGATPTWGPLRLLETVGAVRQEASTARGTRGSTARSR